MGCSPNRQISYNNYESQVHNTDFAGPFVRTTLNSYQENEKIFNQKSLIEDLIKSFKTNANRPCLGSRKPIPDDNENKNKFETEFTYMSYGEVYTAAENLATKLVSLDLTVKAETGHEFVGIFSKNCAEWLLTDIACQLMSVTTATFYSTLGEESFKHICDQTKVSTIFCATDTVATLLKYKKSLGLDNVKNVVVYDFNSKLPEDINAEECGIKLHSFKELTSTKETSVELRISKPETAFTLCYTSGTTSLPKGAEILQKNMASQLINLEDAGIVLNNNSVHFSYLPLAHVMERVCILGSMMYGAKIGFITGDVRKFLKEDIALLKPTFLIAVPRVLATLRQGVLDIFKKLPAGCKKNLVERALRVKRENIAQNGSITHSLYDKLVFKAVREKFGGNIEFMVTGSAPLTKEIADDVKLLFSVPIIEAYGLTECCGACVVTYASDHSNSNAGGCLRTAKIKLLKVDSMKYGPNTTYQGESSPTGEVCIYGPIVFKGYYLNEEETKKAIDEEGWFRTGDVGRIMPGNNGLKIIDRVKEIFKLSQGEYIAPGKLESVYSKSKYVAQIFVYGDSTKNHIVSIIVPNPNSIKELAMSLGLWTEGSSKTGDFLDNKDVKAAVVKDLGELATASNFNSLEKINQFRFTEFEMTPDNGLLTPTMKLVRRKAAEKFKAEIDDMYSA